MLFWRWLVLLRLVRFFLVLLLLLLLVWLLLLLLLVWLPLGADKINCILIRHCWPDRACDGDRAVPGNNFWGRLGCLSRWWRR